MLEISRDALVHTLELYESTAAMLAEFGAPPEIVGRLRKTFVEPGPS